MSERIKANPVASNGKPPVEFSSAASFVDGSGLSPETGGIVSDDDQYFSVARSDMVPNGQPAEQTETGWTVPANRVGRISILEADKNHPTTYGYELESARMNGDGKYTDLPNEGYLSVNELYTFMSESGTEPTDDPEEFRDRLWDMVHREVDAAEAAGQLTAALAVYGQTEPGPGHSNPSIYVESAVEDMKDRTGFDPVKIFRVGGAQGHTGVSDTFASVQAAEAMEYISPILASPTLSGPYLNGGEAGNLRNLYFTQEQLEHLRRVGVTPDDLMGPYQSWRYLLRRIGSPSAGVWMSPPPDGQDAYFEAANEKLARGDVNNIDRFNGWHTDRIRMVLNGDGSNTIEDCSADTALGNPDTLVPMQLLRSALTTRFEEMAIQGRDPRMAVASMLGTAGLDRQSRLDLAHEITLKEVMRYGNDAITYDRKIPGQWLGALLEIADEAPHTSLDDSRKESLHKTFATKEDTAGELRQWCQENNTDTPTAQAYFDLGLSNPAIYLEWHHDELKRQRPEEPAETLVRQVELNAARALHRASKLKQEQYV